MKLPRLFFLGLTAWTAVLPLGQVASAATELLNVSYDPTRELFDEINKAFIPDWKATAGEDISIRQSHGGSSKQARAVLDGLPADVVTLALAYDIDVLAAKGLVASNWQERLPDHAVPYSSTIVFLVRKGNPKQIKDWSSLIQPGIEVIATNPKTSGGARWSYLAAWGAELRRSGGDEAKARDYVSRFYHNVKVLDTGARGSTVTFAQRSIGDVLVSWENEAYLALKEFGPDQFTIVVPSQSIKAEPVVAVVDQVVDKHGTRKQAEAYLKYLYTPKAQQIIAKNHFRPSNAEVERKSAGDFSKVELFTIDQVAGGWNKAQKTHFADGGVFDQIYVPQAH